MRLAFASSRSGGRRWWAHLALTRMNIGPIILRNKIEDRLDVWEFGHRVPAHRFEERCAVPGLARVGRKDLCNIWVSRGRS